MTAFRRIVTGHDAKASNDRKVRDTVEAILADIEASAMIGAD
jgi:hypothetical protein